jgi:hypothetical protein
LCFGLKLWSGLSPIENPIFVERFDKIRALVLVAIQRPCLWCLCGGFFFNHLFFFCWFVCCFWRFLYQISGCISANHQPSENLSKRQKLEFQSQRSYCCKLHVATSSPTQISTTTTTEALILDCSNSHCCKGAYIDRRGRSRSATP